MHIGVDIRKSFCQATVLDDRGNIVETAKVPTDLDHLERFFCRYPGSHAVIESNTVWEFVCEKLRSLGLDVVLANPIQVKAIAQARVKTDAVDSRTLAHLLRADLIPEAWVGPAPIRELR